MAKKTYTPGDKARTAKSGTPVKKDRPSGGFKPAVKSGPSRKEPGKPGGKEGYGKERPAGSRSDYMPKKRPVYGKESGDENRPAKPRKFSGDAPRKDSYDRPHRRGADYGGKDAERPRRIAETSPRKEGGYSSRKPGADRAGKSDSFRPKPGAASHEEQQDQKALPSKLGSKGKPLSAHFAEPLSPKADKAVHKKGEESDFFESKALRPRKRITKDSEEDKPEKKEMPLNKFIAHCGICSRREAVELIKQGKVKVNSLVEPNPATRVTEKDVVIYEGKRVFPQRKLVYYLLNKPKDYITTTDDPEGRKTVLDLFEGIEDKRIFPVGRLDRNTTGLLLLTNDGELAQKLAHPRHRTVKVYQVGLDMPLQKEDFDLILKGIMLEDGRATVDELAITDPRDMTQVGIQIHIGRNRIVRRIFEHLGYQVKTLDRVVFAGLTKKNLPRGKWRELTPKEVVYLKHFK